VPDELAELQPDPQPDDGTAKPVEHAARRFGRSKDHRDDLPQVVIAMAVTGLPRVSRTGDFVFIYATSCEFRYSLRTSCGVR